VVRFVGAVRVGLASAESLSAASMAAVENWATSSNLEAVLGREGQPTSPPVHWCEPRAIVMEVRGLLRDEIGKLMATGRELSQRIVTENLDPRVVNDSYQVWYTQALRAVRQVIPERRREFAAYYRSRRGGEGRPTAISDILSSLGSAPAAAEPGGGLALLFDPGMTQTFLHLLGIQLAILASALPTLEPQGGFLDSDLAAAWALLRRGQRRAAGTLAQLALERHLRAVARQHNVTVKRETPRVAKLNRVLMNAGVYPEPRWRRIQHLAEVGELCVCDNKRRPARKAVRQLIAGVDETLTQVF
jgi:hypothetical protein